MLLDRLEALVETGIDGFFGAIFRGRVQPLEITRRLTREMEASKVISLNRVYVPNTFVVGLHPSDMDHLRPLAPELEAEFQRFLGEWIVDHDYTVNGPVQVSLTVGPGVRAGQLRITPRMDEAAAPAAAHPRLDRGRERLAALEQQLGPELNEDEEDEDAVAGALPSRGF